LRRITKAALGGLAGCALALGGTQVAVGVIEMFTPQDGDVTNLPIEGPFDSAFVTLQVQKNGGEGTTFVLDVTKINTTFAGQEFGAHLHTKDCDDYSSGLTRPGGPHYNHEVHGVVPGKQFPSLTVPEEDWAEVSRRTEVWFDLVPNADGVASDSTTVKFVPVDPEVVTLDPEDPVKQPMSIVLHNAPTAPKTGSAGDRGACFTLDAEWAEEPAP
jgi:hypothetical protein